MNTFGNLFRITTFGESHGSGLGCVVDGCPPSIPIDEGKLVAQLDRRRPGQSDITTARKESDKPEILSGIFEGKTLGTPIAMIVRNKDARSDDYDKIKTQPRVGHADATWKAKYSHVDHRGGGRSSGRETVSRVMGGWIAESLLERVVPELQIVAFVSQVGDTKVSEEALNSRWTRNQVDEYACRCPEKSVAVMINQMLLDAKKSGDSYGGAVTLRISGVPVGLGEPVFMKLQSYMTSALATVGTVNGIWWNQRDINLSGKEFHETGNTYGGLNGGISNGEDLVFHIAGKPVSTIGENAKKGRHDPCVLPRAVPVFESMAAIVLADLYLMKITNGLNR